MCQIIQRKPNFVIPYNKFEASIINNPDGYGLTFPDDKGLTVLRSQETPDPEKLYRMVNEELIDRHIMLHLRFTTAGETNLRNAHPFPVLEKATDGIDLRMAHNGTLHKYKTAANKGESDTRCFVRTYVRPLFKRLIKGMDASELLNDEFVAKLLDDQLTTASVLTFIDSEGNTLNVNPTGNGGKQEEDWYYSNTYSFNERHRLPKTKVTTGTTYTNGRYGNGGKGTSTSTTVTDTKSRKFTGTFKCGIKDLYHLTDDTIHNIVKAGTPASDLIKELLAENMLLSDKLSDLEFEHQLLKVKCK